MRAGSSIGLSVSNGRVAKFMAEVQGWLKANNISQTELAEALGVSESLISLWFSGARFPIGEEVLHLQELMAKRRGSSRK